jgi:hypothetical protein
MAVYPNARGFAYVVLEGLTLVDWGASDMTSAQRGQLAVLRVAAIFDRYEVDVFVLREVPFGRDSGGLARLAEGMDELARERDIPLVTVSREQVRKAFADVVPPTRYAIAESIAQSVPALRPLLPAKRKIWTGESRRMGLFDAAALAIAFVHQNGRR